MNLKFSAREKMLLYLAAMTAVFALYWYLLLNPLLVSMNKKGLEIRSLQIQLEQVKTKLGSPLGAVAKKYEFYPKEEQLTKVMKFINYKFRWFGIKLISLQQVSDNKKLTLNLKFRSSYYQLLGFLNSLPQSEALLVVDNANIVQKEEHVIAEMRLLSGYL